MYKGLTYMRYLFEYLRHLDLLSIFASVNYLLQKKTHKNDRIIRTSIGIFHCRKNTNDFQFANLMYEWSVKRFLFPLLDGFTVFIDSGACIGDYSILFAKRNLRCYAFEPIPDNFRIMEENFALNKLDGAIRTFPFGLGDRNEEVRFCFNPVNTGASHIDRNNLPNGITVEIRTLDSLYPEMDIAPGDKILVKLDAETMEPEALRGAKEFIKKFPDITFVIEDKFIGDEVLKSILDRYAVFEYGKVDPYNMFARKVGDLK